MTSYKRKFLVANLTVEQQTKLVALKGSQWVRNQLDATPWDFDKQKEKQRRRLIEAGPELLEAAELALSWLRSTGADGSPMPSLIAAIAKATGEKP